MTKKISTKNAIKVNSWKKKLEILIDSKNIEKDWDYRVAYFAGFLNDQGEPKYDENNFTTLDYFPREKDLRETWWNISTQGENHSCIGWAVTDVLRWHLVKKKQLDKKTILSARFTWMAAKEMDSFTSRPTTFIEKAGSSLKAALDVCRKYGAVPDTILPSKNEKLYQGDTTTFYAIAAQYKLTHYFNLKLNSNLIKPTRNNKTYEEYQIILWKKWIVENGPIIVRLKIDSTWLNTRGETLKVYDKLNVFTYHAVSMVGYKDNQFILRNSWGERWGNKGFISVSKEYALAAFDEAYGIIIRDNMIMDDETTGAPHDTSELPCGLFYCDPSRGDFPREGN